MKKLLAVFVIALALLLAACGAQTQDLGPVLSHTPAPAAEQEAPLEDVTPAEAQPEEPATPTDDAAEGDALSQQYLAYPAAEKNGLGIILMKLSKADDAYSLRWDVAYEGLNNGILAAQINIVDAADLTKSVGVNNFTFDTTKEDPYLTIGFKSDAQLALVTFNGAPAAAGELYETSPLFFVVKLGDEPEILDMTPRGLGDLTNQIPVIKTDWFVKGE